MSTALGPYSRTNNYVFDPSQVSGLALWLDAADDSTVIRTGTTVTRWNDKSGSNNNAVPHATGPQYIQNIQNSLPGLYFAGSNTLKCGAFLTATNVSCFLVTNKNANVGLGVWKKQFGSYFIMENVIKVGVNNFTGYIENALITVPNFTNTNIYALTLSSSSSVGSAFTFNGSFNGSNTTISGTSIYGNATTCDQQVSIGGLMETGSPISQMTGYINEIVLYNTALTTTQRQQIEGYLAWKWSLQRNLPTTHPYFNSPYVAYNQIVNIPQRIFNNNTLFPNQVSGLALWLDAADDATVIRTGSAVTRWNDKSGNIRNLTTVLIGAGTITYTNVSLVFSNTAYMFINTPVNLQNFTVFFIGKTLVTSGSANNQMIFCVRPSSGFSYNSADGLGLYYDYTATKQTRFYGAGFVPMQDTVTFVNPVLNCYTQNAAGSLSSFLYGSNTSNVVTTARTTTGQGFAVGAEASSGGYVTIGANNFQMNEVIVYNSVLSTTQRQQIEGYLAYKWNLKSNLPLTHPAYTPAFVPSGSINVKPYIWAPTQISGCALWLDAADANSVIRTGSNVTQWNDKSGNGYNMSSNTNYGTTTLPTYSSNTTNKYVQMAPNQALCSALYNYTTAWSVFVCMNNVIVGERFMVSPYVTVNLVMMSMNLGNNKIWQNAFTTTPTDIIGNHIEYTSAENTNALSNLLYYRDGVIQASNVKNMGVAANASAKMGIGANATVNNAMSGTYQVYEVLIYNTYLNIQQRQQIEGYLAWKWGLKSNLPSSHPFFNFPPG